MTPHDGLLDLEATYKKELAMGWAFIRKLALFVGEWGPGYIYQVADHLGKAPKTLQNYVSLARNPISHYAEKLGLSRADASAVLGLPEEEAKALLLTAAEQGHADDWLRFEARAKRLPPTGKEQTVDVRTYEGQTTLTAIDDGGAKHRANGVDPHYGVTVAEADGWEWCTDCNLPMNICRCDVPFCLPPDPIDAAAEDDTAFDVAERVVAKWGVLFAKQVAEEIERWGEWQDVTATVHER